MEFQLFLSFGVLAICVSVTYELTTKEVDSVTSTPAASEVYYEAHHVTLNASATTVNAGTSVSLTCSSYGGNPSPGLVIYDATSGGVLDELVQSSGTTFTSTKLTQKSDHGAKYACKTKVNVAHLQIPIITSINTITLNVQFPPNGLETLPPTVDVDEGQMKSIRCQTTSSSNPETTLAWSGPPSLSGTSSPRWASEDYGNKSTSDTNVTGDRTSNGATYTCNATHLGKQVFEATTTMNVNFAPNGIVMYDTANTSILENQSRVMKCRSETSRPAGTITWRKLINGKQSVVSAEAPRKVPGDYGGTVLESEITIIATEQENGAEYWCQVDYTYSNGTKVVKKTSTRVLTVNYPVDEANTTDVPVYLVIVLVLVMILLTIALVSTLVAVKSRRARIQSSRTAKRESYRLTNRESHRFPDSVSRLPTNRGSAEDEETEYP